MTARRRWLEHRRRAAGHALVLVLHGVLWWGLAQALRPVVTAPEGDAANTPVVLWLMPQPAQNITRADAAVAAAAPPERLGAAARAGQVARQRTPPRDATPGTITLPAVVVPDASVQAQVSAPDGAAAPAEAASAAGPVVPLYTGPLLDAPATRRVLREAARQRSVAELAAQASSEPARLSTEQRLGREIEQAAIGDCLKGEFFGGGGGLLSLPFLLAAELRGRCRR